MSEAAPTFVRWLWVWITIGALVVVVVVGFLLGIVSSLESIDEGLFSADRDVNSIQGETKPLPTYVQNINGNLTQIDTALKPIRGQANQILGALRSIQGSLVSVDSSLIDTSASLVDTSSKLGNITGLLVNTSGTLGTISSQLVSTSGTLQVVSRSLVSTAASLVDTSNAVGNIRSLAGRIDSTLIAAQRPGSNGTNAIWRRVRFLNGGLFRRAGNDNDTNNLIESGGVPASTPSRSFPATANTSGIRQVEADASQILGGLVQVNLHLTSICNAPILTSGIVLPPLVQANGPC